ncbi:MAG: Dolichyl-phosphate-mannose-protein mannosyltransferase [Actinomycetia bacterium]|nr:Dolichyl-phosphate-mannose-protein mannosyltransferase [Actinomycetes bacterium]
MLGGTVAPTKSAGPSRSTGAVRADALALAGVALALRLPAFFAARHLYPDDGEYGMSVVAMRAGGLPFRDVFSSQGPLHLPLLYLGDLVGLRTFDAPRVTPVLAGVVATVLTYFIARRLTSRAGA